jgi:hypothetical protein
MSKATQGFAARRTCGTSQPKTRGERRSSEKELFMDGNELGVREIEGHDERGRGT